MGRRRPGDDVVVIANPRTRGAEDYRVQMLHPGRWALRFNPTRGLYSTASGNHASSDVDGDDASITIAPYTVLIYALVGGSGSAE